MKKRFSAKWQIWELSLTGGLLLAILLSSFLPFQNACSQVRSDTLRLHILSNSDSEEDQALKLAVRDAILETQADLFGSAASKEEAMETARQQMENIQAVAQQTVREAGYSYPVTARLENLYFATREYEDFTLPAGRYDAVRIEIGEHQGHNWFCVLFPPLCVPAAVDSDEFPQYSDEEEWVVKSPYQIKFAAVELLEQLKEELRQP